MESYYGGKQGFSFVVVKEFPSIKEMTENFKKGPNYTDVNYDEYVIIDTVDKNSGENGKIFRRGYDYNTTEEIEAVVYENNVIKLNEDKSAAITEKIATGGAVYIGQIVGPAGAGPHVVVKEYDEIITRINEADKSEAPLYERGKEVQLGLSDGTLIPGKNIETGEFKDTIDIVSFSMRDEFGMYSTAYIGFQIPYHIIEFDAQTKDAYYNRNNDTDSFDNLNLVDVMTEDEDEQGNPIDHPFYQKWMINVPKGIKGDVSSNFRVATVTTDMFIIGSGNDYPSVAEINNNFRKVLETDNVYDKVCLVYDYTNYDKKADGDTVTIVLGQYDILFKNEENNPIRFAPDGSITVTETNREYTIDKLINWLTEVSLDENGKFTFVDNNGNLFGESKTYNPIIKYVTDVTLDEKNDGKLRVYGTTGEDNHTQYSETQLDWIRQVNIAEDGTVSYDHADDNKEPDKQSELLTWIKAISLNEETGELDITFNNDNLDYTAENADLEAETNHFKDRLDWIKGVSFDDDGTLTFIHTKEEDTVFEKEIKWVTEVGLNDDGDFHIAFNNGDDTYTTQLDWINEAAIAADGTVTFGHTRDEDTTFDKLIKWISAITFDDNGKFQLDFNNGADSIVKDINWIKSASMGSNGELSIEFNNSNIQNISAALSWLTEATLNSTESQLTLKANRNLFGDSNTLIIPLNYVSNITLDETGLLKITKKDGSSETTQLNWISNIDYDDGNKQFTITDNQGNKTIKNVTINQIESLSLDEDYNLYAKYSLDDEPVLVEGGPLTATINITNSGSVFQIAGMFDLDAESELSTVEQLNEKYPDGLSEDLKGFVLVVIEDSVQMLYAFDYLNTTWFRVQ